MGREGPRVRERYTRQLRAAEGLFVPTLKGGWQWICSREGFGLGNAHPLSTKACRSLTATSLFFQVHVLSPLCQLRRHFRPTTPHEGGDTFTVQRNHTEKKNIMLTVKVQS